MLELGFHLQLGFIANVGGQAPESRESRHADGQGHKRKPEGDLLSERDLHVNEMREAISAARVPER